jgi:hypothetical protein
MHVIYSGNHIAKELDRITYEREREGWRWAAINLGVLTLMAAMLAAQISHLFWPVAVLATITVAAGLALIYYNWRYRVLGALRARLRAGLRGQQQVTEILSGLDDTYYVIVGLKLPGKLADIDHLVVGPNGVFAFETKNHRGRITIHRGKWVQVKVSRRGHMQPEETMADPVRQLKRNVDYLRSCINATDRALARRTRLWIEGAVVFVHPGVLIDLPEALRARLPFPVLRGRDLPRFILEHVPRRGLLPDEVEAIVRLFGGLEAPAAEIERG